MSLAAMQFLLLGRLAVLAQEVAERPDVLLQPAVGHVAAVAARGSPAAGWLATLPSSSG